MRGIQARGQGGFTLIEIMVVVVIISVLIALAAPSFMGRAEQAKVTAAKTDLTTFGQALEMYRLDNSHYPSTDQGLEALVSKPSGSPEPKSWNIDGYLAKGKLPVDPWGNPYQYYLGQDRRSFDLFSYGADGREGGEGLDADIFFEDI
jgi:general secretion pathway protein G